MQAKPPTRFNEAAALLPRRCASSSPTRKPVSTSFNEAAALLPRRYPPHQVRGATMSALQ